LEKAFGLLYTLLRFAHYGFVGIKRIVGSADDIRQFLQLKDTLRGGTPVRSSGAQGDGEFFFPVVNIKT
jgi:hypothetical protein